MSPADLLEQLQRQLDELQALRAVFSDDPCCFDNTSTTSAAGFGGGSDHYGLNPGVQDDSVLLLSPPERQALQLATQVCEAVAKGAPGAAGVAKDASLLQGLPLLSGTLRPPGVLYGGQSVALRFTLPRSYPGGSTTFAGEESSSSDSHNYRRACLAVECCGPRRVHERLSEALEEVTRGSAEAGCECLLLAVNVLRDAVEQLQRRERFGPADTAGEARGAVAGAAVAGVDVAAAVAKGGVSSDAIVGDSNGGGGGGGVATTERGGAASYGSAAEGAAAAAAAMAGSGACWAENGREGLLCVLVWLHHLKSLAKRKLIVQWARDLNLAGASKPGFPGVVVVEGHSADVREFLSRMRAVSWQAMQVRGEDLLRAAPPHATAIATAITATAGATTAHATYGAGSGGVSSGVISRRCGAASAVSAASAAAAAAQEERQGPELAVATAVESVRRLAGPGAMPFRELAEEGGMAALGAMCRQAGLHHVFMTALKL